MPRVEESFEELRARLRQRERMVERTGEPIYYLVFAPKEMQSVKRKLPLWKVKAGKPGRLARGDPLPCHAYPGLPAQP